MRTRPLSGLAGGALLSAALVVLAPPASLAEPVNDCQSADNTDPNLNQLTLSATSVDVTTKSKTISISALASDDGGPGSASGIAYVEVTLVSYDTPGNYLYQYLTRHGTQWTGQVTINKGMANGAWRLSAAVGDKANNYRNYAYEDLNQPFYDRDLSVTSQPDTAGPSLNAFSMSPTTVNTRRHPAPLSVTAKATDPGTGVSTIQVSFRPKHGTGLFSNSVFLTKVKGHRHLYRGLLTVTKGLGRNQLIVDNVNLQDNAQNSTFLATTALDAQGFDTSVKVRSHVDTTKPRISHVQVSRRHLDSRHKTRHFTVTLRASDTGSGLGYTNAVLKRGGQILGYSFLKPVKGTRHGFRTRITVRRCSGVKGDYHLHLVLGDAVGNVREKPAGRIHIKAFDHTVPTYDLESDSVATAGPVALTFDEDVDGVSTTSVIVTQDNGLTQVPMSPPTCADASDLPTDCMTGPVRSASFMPIAPFTSGGFYEVIVNPQGNLDVTDLAGNPLRRASAYFTAS